jgi:DNA replication protein DnaC
VILSDSTASGSLEPNPSAVTPLPTEDYERLKAQHADLWLTPNTCLTCNTKGTFRTLRNGEEVTMKCNCVEQWILHLWMLNSGIGLGYQRLGWDAIKGVSSEVMLKIADYLEHGQEYANIGHGLTLVSSSRGTGKTLLMTLLLRRLAVQNVDVYFCQFNQLINLHTAGWRDAEARRWFERRVINAGALGIDDVGKENSGRGEMVPTLVDEILRTRIQHSRPTFLTSNLTTGEMGERYLSDVIELFSGSNEEIDVSGESYRPVHRDLLKDAARRGLRFPVVAE